MNAGKSYIYFIVMFQIKANFTSNSSLFANCLFFLHKKKPIWRIQIGFFNKSGILKNYFKVAGLVSSVLGSTTVVEADFLSLQQAFLSPPFS